MAKSGPKKQLQENRSRLAFLSYVLLVTNVSRCDLHGDFELWCLSNPYHMIVDSAGRLLPRQVDSLQVKQYRQAVCCRDWYVRPSGVLLHCSQSNGW